MHSRDLQKKNIAMGLSKVVSRRDEMFSRHGEIIHDLTQCDALLSFIIRNYNRNSLFVSNASRNYREPRPYAFQIYST